MINLAERAIDLVAEIRDSLADVPEQASITVVRTDPRKLAKVDLAAGAVAIMPAPGIDAVAPTALSMTWTVVVVVNNRVGWDRIAQIVNGLVGLHDRGYELQGDAVDFQLPDVGDVPVYALTLTEEHPV